MTAGFWQAIRKVALQQPPCNDPVDRIGHRRQHTAGGEDDQSADDNGHTPDPVRQGPERNLQTGLRQAVRTDGQADQERRRPAQFGGVQRQNRKH